MLVYRLMGLMATRRAGGYALISYGLLVWLGRHPDPARPGRVRAGDRAGHRRQRAGLRARPRGVRPRRGDGLGRALDTGYRKAWSAILDSNVTTLLAAGLLFFFASGPVKGFGVTLSIGVVASMVSALVVARVLTDLVVRRPLGPRGLRLSGLAGTGRLRSLAGPSAARS